MIDIEIIGNQISNENAVNSNRSISINNTRSNTTKVDEFQVIYYYKISIIT
jgi:hypothetical protein